MELRIDPEFQRAVPPLSDDEWAGLQESITVRGVLDPIKVWNDTIVDGHHRYRIAAGENEDGEVFDFDTVNVEFESREEALAWILRHQLREKRNLTDGWRMELVESLYEAEKEAAKQRSGARNDLAQNLPQNFGEGSNSHEKEAEHKAAEEAGVSRETFRKWRSIKRSSIGDYLSSQVKAGDMSTDKAYRLGKTWDACEQEIAGELIQLDEEDFPFVLDPKQIEKLSGFSVEFALEVLEAIADYDRPDVYNVHSGEKYINNIHKKEERERLLEERRKVAERISLDTWVHSGWEDFVPSLPEGSISLLLTDPPYGMDYRSNHRIVRHSAIENDSEAEALSNIAAMLEAAYPKLASDAHVLVFTSPRLEPAFREIVAKAGYSLKSYLVWAKNNTSMGDLSGTFAPKHERIIHAVKGDPPMLFREADVLYADRIATKDHPTEKPEKLLTRLIEATAPEGTAVLDPYGGVASTIAAAEGSGRRGFGCEVDADYHAAGLIRLSEIAEGKAV